MAARIFIISVESYEFLVSMLSCSVKMLWKWLHYDLALKPKDGVSSVKQEKTVKCNITEANVTEGMLIFQCLLAKQQPI